MRRVCIATCLYRDLSILGDLCTGTFVHEDFCEWGFAPPMAHARTTADPAFNTCHPLCAHPFLPLIFVSVMPSPETNPQPNASPVAVIDEMLQNLPVADLHAQANARAHQLTLTKPPGALGQLEDIAVFLAGWQGTATPQITKAQALVFAGNHGVCAQGVNAFPQAVTQQMVDNFHAGGAAINQLCQIAGAELSVIPLDLDRPTQDFTTGCALSSDELAHAFHTGATAVDTTADVVVLGEMGIGNSTVASALCAALFDGEIDDWLGPGAGADAAGMDAKSHAIAAGLARHAGARQNPISVLQAFGGREQTALCGAIVGARGPHPGAARWVHLHSRGGGVVCHLATAFGPLSGWPCQRGAGPPKTSERN